MASTDVLRRLEATCAEVTADGTDPRLLARVLGWAVRPRRSLDALRRSCRDASEPVTLSEAIGSAVSVDDARSAVELVAAWRRLGVRVAVVGDPDYPQRLAEGWPHVDAPVLLAWRGVAPHDGPAVALVGARRATGYGTGVTTWLAAAAADAGVRVVSGGALGIDAAAHDAAIGRPGGTTVVLGCGHEVAYPRPHARAGGLFDRVLQDDGTIVSELLPFEPPHPGQVRARNRIVAALADVVVVVEGREGSGALLTAAAAADRGRTVLAVPGDVRAPGSAAPHRLLTEGAAPCTGPDELLAAFGQVVVADEPAVATVATVLPEAAYTLLADAWPRPVPLDRLAAAAGRPVPALLAAVTRARVAGEVVEGAEGIRLRRAPA
jgi:DNA processing protein